MNHHRAIVISIVLVAGSCTPGPPPMHAHAGAAPLEVRLVTDEAEAALAILAVQRSNGYVTPAQWERLFASEGYRRLKQREAAMGRAFEDTTFRQFLLSDTLAARAPELARTLEEWKRADLTSAARRALAYLPAGTRLRARLYPVIKPRPNSFVFDLGTDSAAIFLFLDPQVSRARLENTLAHELHHIGYATACREPPGAALPERVRAAVQWMDAFGEGIAMLAAAGGPDVHPHAVSGAEERARWDRGITNHGSEMHRLESFFLDVIEGRLTDPDAVRGAAMAFFGEQGPWYTVGWTMAASIERVYGRQRLVEILCEPGLLLRTYNEAAEVINPSRSEPLPLWSAELLGYIAPPR